MVLGLLSTAGSLEEFCTYANFCNVTMAITNRTIRHVFFFSPKLVGINQLCKNHKWRERYVEFYHEIIKLWISARHQRKCELIVGIHILCRLESRCRKVVIFGFGNLLSQLSNVAVYINKYSFAFKFTRWYFCLCATPLLCLIRREEARSVMKGRKLC